MKKVLRFTASWCAPCKGLAMTLNSIDTPIPFDVIDIEEQQELAVKYQIRSVPTMVMLEDDVEVKRMTGVPPQTQIEEWLA